MRIFYFIIPLVLALVILCGIYLFNYIRRVFVEFGLEKTAKKTKIFSLIITVIIGACGMTVFSTPAVMALMLVSSCVIVDIISLIFKKLIKNQKANKVWKAVKLKGLLALIFTIAMIGYGYVNMHIIRETDYEITVDKDIDGKELTILQISDLHLGINMDAEALKSELSKISDKGSYDVIALTGDIFDENTTYENMVAACKYLGEMKSTYGVFYVYGNHDSSSYATTPNYSKEDLGNALLDNNITVLCDEEILVEDKFYIVGRDDTFKNPNCLEIDKLMTEVDTDKFVLVLDHQPTQLEEVAASGADLMLSGHTHYGQIWPVGWFFELFHINEMTYGIKQVENTNFIVSSGIAGWGYSIRTQGVCEYVVVNVKGK